MKNIIEAVRKYQEAKEELMVKMDLEYENILKSMKEDNIEFPNGACMRVGNSITSEISDFRGAIITGINRVINEEEENTLAVQVFFKGEEEPNNIELSELPDEVLCSFCLFFDSIFGNDTKEEKKKTSSLLKGYMEHSEGEKEEKKGDEDIKDEPIKKDTENNKREEDDGKIRFMPPIKPNMNKFGE